MSGRRRAAAARVSYNPSEGDSEQREERRSKAMAQLVYLGMAKLDDIAATDDRKSGPFKPGQVAEACFMVAPDGKFKGMRFRKAELMQSLRVLGVPPTTEASKDGEQQIFSVAPMTKSGQVRYSSYPIDTSTLQEGNRKRGDDAYGPNPDIICGIRVPSQRVLWPSWPDQRAIDLQKAVSERKALDDVEREKEQAKKELEKPDKKPTVWGHLPSRRSTRETVSTVVWIDGHRVLKANNYSLEEGESSVWDSEMEKSIPPPKKPATAYMLYCSKFRKERAAEAEKQMNNGDGGEAMEEDGPGDRAETYRKDTEKKKKNKANVNTDEDDDEYVEDDDDYDDDDDDDDFGVTKKSKKRKAKRAPSGDNKSRSKGTALGGTELMDEMVATWRSMTDEDKEEFKEGAAKLKEEYELAVEDWKVQVKQRDEQRQERVRAVRAIPTEEEALALALAGSMEQSGETNVSSTDANKSAQEEGGSTDMAVDDSASSSSTSSSSSALVVATTQPSLGMNPPSRRGASLLNPDSSNRTIINWGDVVSVALTDEPLVPGGLNFDDIQKRLVGKGHERKWFELRAPLKTLLKRGAARRTLTNLATDDAFLTEVLTKYEVDAAELKRVQEEEERAEAERSAIEAAQAAADQKAEELATRALADAKAEEAARAATAALTVQEATSVESSAISTDNADSISTSSAASATSMCESGEMGASVGGSSSASVALGTVNSTVTASVSALAVERISASTAVDPMDEDTQHNSPAVQPPLSTESGSKNESGVLSIPPAPASTTLTCIPTAPQTSQSPPATIIPGECVSCTFQNDLKATDCTMCNSELPSESAYEEMGYKVEKTTKEASTVVKESTVATAMAVDGAQGASTSFSASSSSSSTETPPSVPPPLPGAAEADITTTNVASDTTGNIPRPPAPTSSTETTATAVSVVSEPPKRFVPKVYQPSARELKRLEKIRVQEEEAAAAARARAEEAAEAARPKVKIGAVSLTDAATRITEKDKNIVVLEAMLRRWIMEEAFRLTFPQQQQNTTDFPEDGAVDQTLVADMSSTLESESVLTLPKLKAALSEAYCNHDVFTFDYPTGWQMKKKGRHWVYYDPKNPARVFSRREDVEKEVESASRRRGQVYLGHINGKTGKWDISTQAMTVAIAYLVGGLSQSKHMCIMVHNTTEAIVPANLYVAGPPFPTAGKNKQEVARKEHNTKLAMDAARARLSSMKYVAAQMDLVRPFLDPQHAVQILTKVGASDAAAKIAAAEAAKRSAAADATAAAAAELDVKSSTVEYGGEVASLPSPSSSDTLAAVAEVAIDPFTKKKMSQTAQAAAAEAKAAKEELERQVDLSTLPVMTLPAPLLTQPASIQGTMRSYQLEGLSWLVHGFRHGVNGILADEMGLGKTLQTISFLSHITLDAPPEEGGSTGPHLVIVPLSVLTSWVLEIRRFCPKLRVVRLHSGDEKERERLRREVLADVTGYDIVVTTYDMVVGSNMKHCLTRQWWRCMVLDEGHKIKNEETDISEACRRIRCVHRVLLTGTPMQNNLHELWAMLNFLLPDVFISSEPFDNCFDLTRGKVDKDMLDQAHHLMQLFSLRRLKSEVEVSLPPKNELKISVPLSEFQIHFYRALLMKDVSLLKQATQDQQATLGNNTPSDSAVVAGRVADGLANENSEESSEWKRLQSLMMQLRKCCDHPYLFSGADPNPTEIDEGIITSSNKMVLLDRLLPKLKANGHRVLIFSQFTSMLDILDDYCRFRGYEHARLDGSTNRVQRAIDVRRFNQDQSPLFIFLMSTRAGGLGINLQTSDTVILYDSDWNPQVDLQAIGRAHRIGQTKTVHVYRLITEGAVEERIYDRAQKKLFLSEMVNRDSTGPAEELDRLGKKELLQMLSFGADQIFQNQGKLPTDEEIDAIIDRSEKTKVITSAAAGDEGSSDESKSMAASGSRSTYSTWSSPSNENESSTCSASSSAASTSSSLQSGTQNANDFDAAVASVSIRSFQGIEYAAKKEKKVLQSTEDIAAAFHTDRAKREGKSRFVEVDGFKVLKLNNYEVTGSSYKFEDTQATRGGSGKKKIAKQSSKRQVAGRDYKHESTCLVCWDGGNVILCDRCPAVYHGACLGYSPAVIKSLSSSQWSCPHHQCMECGRKAQAVGGLIFRCECCPAAYCEDHLPIDAELVGHCKRFEDLGMRHPDQACYIHHNADCHKWAQTYVYKQKPVCLPVKAGDGKASSNGSKKKAAVSPVGGEKKKMKIR